MAGQIASPKRTGQPSFVPRICSMPSTWETRRPTVTASWFTVPRPPLRFNGAISDMYMGTNEVFKPQLTPMMNRPKNNISYDSASFVKPIRHAPTMPSTLFSSKPPFLRFRAEGANINFCLFPFYGLSDNYQSPRDFQITKRGVTKILRGIDATLVCIYQKFRVKR